MTDFYDYWFKLDKTNSEQAAFVFNRKDPRLYDKRINFPAKENDFSRVKPNTWQWDVLETYYIFETADWGKYIDDDPYLWFRSPKEASPSQFYSLALDKGIPIPELLGSACLQVLKRQRDSDYRKSMVAALKEHRYRDEQNKAKNTNIIERNDCK